MPKAVRPKATKRKKPARAPQYTSVAYKAVLAQLAAGVRSLRADRDWTQEEAAHRADMPLRLYQAVEGEEANATLTTLARLCQGFDVPVQQLFTGKR